MMFSTSQILSSDWSRLMSMLSIAFFHFIYYILQFQDFFYYFSNFYVSVRLIIFSCIIILILLNCLARFLFSSLNIFKITVFNSLSDKSQISTLGSITGKLLCSSVGDMFPWYFMFLEALHFCLHVWRSSHFLQSLLTSFWEEIPSFSPIRDSEAFSALFYSYTCSILPFLSYGRVGDDPKIACLLSVLQSQTECWEPPICLFFLGWCRKPRFVCFL